MNILGETTLNLKIGTETVKAKFVIARNLLHDVIIGVDILRKENCIVDFHNNTLSIGQNSIVINTLPVFDEKIIYSEEEISIDRWTVQKLKITKIGDLDRDIVVSRFGKVNVMETVTNISENGETPYLDLFIENRSPLKIKIDKNNPICKIHKAHIIEEINNTNKFKELLSKEFGEDDETICSINTQHNGKDYSKPWRPSKEIKFKNKNLTSVQINQIKRLVDEYWMCFSRDDADIGSVNAEYGVHDIKLTDETPIQQRPYKTPFAKEKVIDECINKMIDMKIIEPANTEWASPVVIVKKPDGSERFCVDYRKVNAATIKDSFPMPCVESKMNKLHGCKFFSLLDCTSGYWQIKLSERAKQISTFICNKGIFSFNVMPFGLCNAGATFQRIMQKALRGLNNSTAYIDDILTFSKSFDDHLIHLKQLFEELKRANVKLKTRKCNVACAETMFLG